MSAPSTSRRILQTGIGNSHMRFQVRTLSATPASRAEKDGVHQSSSDHNNPRDGPAYKAGGMRHKTDNEEQREKAVRGTPEEDVTPAAQHAKANKNAEGEDVNKLQTGPTSVGGKK